jgi:hypothetical protein
MAPFIAENGRLTDAMVAGMVKKKANNFVTSGSAALRFEATKYV